MAGKIQSLKFKNCMYKIKNTKGKSMVGTGKVDFLESKYKEKQKIKTYNFGKFTSGINIKSKEKDFKSNLNDETDPISEPLLNSHYKFDDEDPITNYKKT